jgi:ribosomal protein S4E
LDTKRIDADIAKSKYSQIYSETLESLHHAYINCTDTISKYVEQDNQDYLQNLLLETPESERDIVEQ